MCKVDYKKTDKQLYLPKTQPGMIDVPKMRFIQVDGQGNPNDAQGEYQQAIEILYGLCYTIKFLPKSGVTPEGFFDYTVPPLEGLWWMEGDKGIDFTQKSQYCWTSMIRQPEFVTEELMQTAAALSKKKKPHIDFSKARLVDWQEGLCVQCMHIGSYDDEPQTLQKIADFVAHNNLLQDIGPHRRHHEIYLGDPRRIAPDKRKTVLRHPVKPA